VTPTAAREAGLPEARRQEYLERGYVIVRGVFRLEEVDLYKTRAREYSQGKLPPGSDKMVVRDVRVVKGLVTPDDPEKGIWKYLNPDRYDSLFADYPARPGLLDPIESLVGPDIKAFLVMFIYKPPALDFVHPYHQDAYYFPFGPHDDCIGTWTALDPTDADNGSLCVIPGSHKWGILPHDRTRNDSGNHGVLGVDGYDGRADEVALELRPGDTVLFHSRLLHKTGSNRSERPRRVITVHYASSRCRPHGEHHQAIAFRLVRGQSYEGCI
jgi:phytanoyl-CoA hydroxylase